jgi:hypothetical protein
LMQARGGHRNPLAHEWSDIITSPSLYHHLFTLHILFTKWTK